MTRSDIYMLLALLVFFIMAFAPRCHAQEFSDIQIVNAIYLSEGGDHATYPYGIRSIKCESKSACRNICLTTVRHNRKRFEEYGYREYPQFVQFLGERYCPTKGRNLSSSEKRLNKNWVKNVEYFLGRGI